LVPFVPLFATKRVPKQESSAVPTVKDCEEPNPEVKVQIETPPAPPPPPP
jgi:hypothetical protein